MPFPVSIDAGGAPVVWKWQFAEHELFVTGISESGIAMNTMRKGAITAVVAAALLGLGGAAVGDVIGHEIGKDK